MKNNQKEIRIGNKVRFLRKNRRFSLSELSELSGVQIATLSRIEHDKMTGTLEVHAQLAKVLGVELYELYLDVKLHSIKKKPYYSGLG